MPLPSSTVVDMMTTSVVTTMVGPGKQSLVSLSQYFVCCFAAPTVPPTSTAQEDEDEDEDEELTLIIAIGIPLICVIILLLIGICLLWLVNCNSLSST